MDPSLIDQYRSIPEVKYMIDKIDECRKILRDRGLLPSQPIQATMSQPFQMQFNLRNF